MEFFETACEDAVSKKVTKVRVFLTPEARRAVEGRKAESEKWIERCVWRFVALQHEADRVSGPMAEFTLTEEAALQLMADLDEIDVKSNV